MLRESSRDCNNKIKGQGANWKELWLLYCISTSHQSNHYSRSLRLTSQCTCLSKCHILVITDDSSITTPTPQSSFFFSPVSCHVLFSSHVWGQQLNIHLTFTRVYSCITFIKLKSEKNMLEVGPPNFLTIRNGPLSQKKLRTNALQWATIQI